jgi:uncharacterized protein (TIGR03437 family)
MSLRHLTVPLLVAAFAAVALAQECPVTTDVATYPSTPLTYPMISNRYAVQYRLGSGDWTDARVYISYYGGTTASPYIKASNYPTDTSMSFASIPVTAGAVVALRVTKLFGTAFPAMDHVSVRPRAKSIHVDSVSGSTVQLSTTTAADFGGDQFILWWDGDAQQSSAIQGLGFFLNPPYARPSGSNVKTIAAPADLTGDLSSFDTLDFEGTVAIGTTGAHAFVVPANIDNVFLAPGAWVQGKLRFTQSGAGHIRRIYGPGVLDASRFGYMWRSCPDSSAHADDGHNTLSWIPLPANASGKADRFVLDGIITSDGNHAVADLLIDGSVSNAKFMSWNGENGGLRLGYTTRVSNSFFRVADDSLMMWGSYITVTNATVWQNWNGGVVNLGWSDNSPGDDCLIDGLYVVKTDWHVPDAPSWTATTLNGSNNAIVASLMVPGTNFGTLLPSVFRNIYVEDPPRVLLSLKILPPDCELHALPTCPVVDLTLPSVLNLDLENVFTPANIVQNSIGFQIVNGSSLTGTMNIGLTNVMLTQANGTVTALTSANAASVGNIGTNGGHINIEYGSIPKATTPPLVPSGSVVNGASFAAGTPIAPGSIASVFGSGFGSSPAGVTVLVGGIVAPLFVVTPQQINFQVPWQLFGQTQAALSVTSGDLTSAPIAVPLANLAPGIFLVNSAGQGAVLVANTAIIAAPVGMFPGSRPAQRGEYISIYCTGLGPVTHEPATGAPAGGDPLSLTSTNPIAASIGGVLAPASFSGLAPGFLGLYQVNVQIPSNSPTGPAIPLTISVGGKTSNQASIAVVAATP